MIPMKTRIPLPAALLLAVLLPAAAQATAPPARNRAPSVPDDPSPLLDLSLDDAWSRFGPPRRLLAVRGEEPWQDDVAFEYEGGFSVFWFRDRLWQIRLAEGYSGSCFGVFLGDSQEKALSLLGRPDRAGEGFLEWRLPFRGYPVRLRALTRDGAVSEIYVYRPDF